MTFLLIYVAGVVLSAALLAYITKKLDGEFRKDDVILGLGISLLSWVTFFTAISALVEYAKTLEQEREARG